jgi:NAD(P)-dependent dehydrogenase (short-subunit alcohol dehydrogenase family)
MIQLEKKVALVSGAGAGIGRATALLLAKLGATVLCTDRDEAQARATADAIGSAARARRLEVTEPDDWRQAMLDLQQRHGRLDILVNTAGISFAGNLDKTTLDDWRRVMAVNVEGVFLATQAAAALMLTQPTGGSIIHVGSVSGVKPAAGAALYCSSKAAVIQFCRAAALELRRRNPLVRVNAISPGGVRTGLWRTMPFFQDMIRAHGSEEAAFAQLSAGSPAGRFAEADEVAFAIAYLASDQAQFLNGTNLLFDDGESL